MIMRLFAIFDKVAQIYTDPISRLNSAVAERDFKTVCGDEGTVYNKHPNDFALYELGSWDPSTGGIESFVPPILVCDGSKFARPNLEVVN